MNSLYIAMNVLRRTLFQRKGLFVFLVVPALVVSLVIGILGREPERIVTIGYINMDQGTLGNHVVKELSVTGAYRLQEASSENALKELVIQRKVDAGFRIPAGFSEDIYVGSKPQIEQYQLSLNEATFTSKLSMDTITSRIIETVKAHQAVGAQENALLAGVEKTLGQLEKHQVSSQVTDYDLYVNSSLNVVIGFLLMFMMGLISSTVTLILEDRKQKTMARIYTAPVRALEITLGNFLGSLSVGTLQVVFVLVFTRYILGFDYKLPFLPHFLIMEFFLLASIGIASAIAGLIKNANHVSAINSLVITPTCMLGGCFWPLEIMPVWMQKLANFVPQTWTIDAVKRMSSGQGFAEVLLNLGVLALFAFILVGIGSAILRPGEAERG